MLAAWPWPGWCDVGELDAFGYKSIQPDAAADGIQIAEGKDAATLEPVVLIFMRAHPDQPDDERLVMPLTPDMADEIADELHRWAERARERHWGP